MIVNWNSGEEKGKKNRIQEMSKNRREIKINNYAESMETGRGKQEVYRRNLSGKT